MVLISAMVCISQGAVACLKGGEQEGAAGEEEGDRAAAFGGSTDLQA